MNQNVLHKSHFLLMLVCLFLIYIDQWTFVCQDKTKRDCLDAPWHFQRGNAFSSAFCIWPVCCKRRLQIFYQSSVGDARRMIMLRGHFLFPRGSFLSFFLFFQIMLEGVSFFKWEPVFNSIQLDDRMWMFATKQWSLLLTKNTWVLLCYLWQMRHRSVRRHCIESANADGVGSCAPPPLMLGCWLALSSWGIIGSWRLIEEGEFVIYSGISLLVGYPCFTVWLHTQVHIGSTN